MTDPITDMLNRIRNANLLSRKRVSIPFSNLKHGIAKILEERGFIEKVEKKGKKTRKIIEIALRYQDRDPAITGLQRVSKPGQRIYASTKNVKSIRDGYGIAIISTSKGLMTDREARKKKLGGEIICKVW